MIARSIILTLVTILSFPALSQQPPELIFTNLTTRDGLSSNKANFITQDSSGFIWIATDDGLNRYDGRHFKIYRHNPLNTNSLPNSVVSYIAVERTGLLWINTANSLCKLDPIRDSFVNYDQIQGRPFIDSQNDLWVASPSGLLYYNRQLDKFERFNLVSDDEIRKHPHTQAVNHITEDKDRRIWCAAFKGIYLFNRPTKTFTLFENPHNNGFTHVFYLSTGRFFTAQYFNGLFEFHPGEKKLFSPTLIKSLTNAVAEYSMNGTHGFLAGTETGLIWLDPVMNRNRLMLHDISNPNSICGNLILHLFKDRQSSVWLATDNGISILNPQLQMFRNIRLSESRNPKSSKPYGLVNQYFDDGNLHFVSRWFARGLDVFNRDWILVQHYDAMPPTSKSLGSKSIYYIHKDESDKLWISTDSGLVSWDRKKNQFKVFVPEERNPLSNVPENLHLEFRKILLHNNTFWIRTRKWGVYVFDPQKEKFTHHFAHDENDEHSLADNATADLLEERNGRIFISTFQGLSEYDPASNNFITYRLTDDKQYVALKNIFLKMKSDGNGNVFICTDHGLLKFNTNTKQFQLLTTANGLAHNYCEMIHFDENGRMLIATKAGLSVYSIVKNTFTNYSVQDGLPVSALNGVFSTTGEGKIVAGYNGGLVVFDTDSLPFNPVPPPIHINGIRVMDKDINYKVNASREKAISLKYDQNVLTVSFSVVNFTNPAQNKFFYQLAGFDKEWHQSEDGNITYTNLNHGTYTLRVKGSNNSGIMNEEGDILNIVIVPAFWQSTWFRVLGILLIAAAIFVIARRRIKFIRHQAYMKQRMAETEMQAMRAQMNPHFIFNCLSSIENFIMQNEKRLASDYLNKFCTLIRSMLDSSLNVLTPLSVDMGNLKIYVELEQLRFHDKFTSKFQMDPELSNGDYKVPPLLVQPYLENAIVHGIAPSNKPDLCLLVKAELQDHTIVYTIEDNGVGRQQAKEYNQINRPHHISLGMAITEERIAHFNGSSFPKGPVLITDLVDRNAAPSGTRVQVRVKAL